MGREAKILSADTVIGEDAIALSQYRAFFRSATGEAFASNADFQAWLNAHTGKTLKEAAEEYGGVAEDAAPSIDRLLSEARFDLVSEADKAFIVAFDRAMAALGYDCGGSIGSGYCWGKYMIIYAKTGARTKKVSARIYIREGEIVLRLFLNDIDARRKAVEAALAPAHIREVLTGPQGDCKFCPDKKDGQCRFRKEYTLGGRRMQKCSGVVFEFHCPTAEKLPDYLNLLRVFYGGKKAARAQF